jgi:hypothetical protein
MERNDPVLLFQKRLKSLSYLIMLEEGYGIRPMCRDGGVTSNHPRRYRCAGVRRQGTHTMAHVDQIQSSRYELKYLIQ